jgi:hypothetical protein
MLMMDGYAMAQFGHTRGGIFEQALECLLNFFIYQRMKVKVECSHFHIPYSFLHRFKHYNLSTSIPGHATT